MKQPAELYTNREDTRKRFQTIFGLIPNDTDTILDVGCARYGESTRQKNNLHGLLVNETNASVKGIDIREDAIRDMATKGYDVTVADAQNFSFDINFDVIVVGEVIEYLANPGIFIENSLSHLSDDGRIIITTENPLAFVYWRKSLYGETQPNVLWFNPDNISELSNQIDDGDVKITWISPDGGISTALWQLGLKKASAPRYAATIRKNEQI